jgi:uncharacterized membrane protein
MKPPLLLRFQSIARIAAFGLLTLFVIPTKLGKSSMVLLALAQTELELGATVVCYFDSLVLRSKVFLPNASSPYFLTTVIHHNTKTLQPLATLNPFCIRHKWYVAI